MNWKARLRNKAFWASALAFICMMAKQFNLFNVPDDYSAVIDSLLGALIALGILVDPTTPGVMDNPQEK